MAEDTTQTPFHEMEVDENLPIDDFFDTSQPASHYNLNSEQFIFDGDEQGFMISPSSLRHAFSGSTNEPLLPGYNIHNTEYHYNDDENNDEWSADHPLALPIARLERQYPNHELSGMNYLNLWTFLIHLTISLLLGSGLLQWLPSPWTVTTLSDYETLLTPSQWAGDYLWIPVLSLEGIFTLVQLLPSVRARPEVVEGVGYNGFYIGMLQSLATLFFCLKWILPAWIALFINCGCLLWLQLRLKEQHSLNTNPGKYGWRLWVFRFPFDVHLGWLLPLLASRASMIFRHYGSHDVGLQLGADIVAMGLLLPCAGAYLVKSRDPRDWVVPLLILWSYVGIGCRLMHTPEALIELYGKDIVEAVRGAAWCFAGTVSLFVFPKVGIWVAREFLTIRVVQLADDDEDADDDLLLNDPREQPAVRMTQF
jgi:hypothetical protein